MACAVREVNGELTALPETGWNQTAGNVTICQSMYSNNMGSR